MNEGYTIRHIPAQEYKVCHGCKYLNTVPVMFGHRTVTNDYTCMNPDAQLVINSGGRWIHLNHQGDCIVPSWCPYLKQKEE
jgi:hypothetical protein